MPQPSSHSISLPTLLVICSFASFGAVLPTPALPQIAQYFHITAGKVETIMGVYLIGYATAQLIYGPLSNWLGRKSALITGILIALLGSLLAIAASSIPSFNLFIIARLLIAIGAAAGLVISMVIIKDIHNPLNARRTFAKVTLCFAIVPFVATALAGNLVHLFGWQSTNLVMLIYSVLVFYLTYLLPETLAAEKRRSLSIDSLLSSYQRLLKHGEYLRLIMLFALSASTSYVFNSLAPIITIKDLHITAASYGWLSFIPSCGILLGGVLSNHFASKIKASTMVAAGIILILASSLVMAGLFTINFIKLSSFYALAVVLFCGTALIIPNASMQALAQIEDHANGASVMNATALLVSSLLVSIAGKFIGLSIAALPITLTIISAVGLLLVIQPIIKKISWGFYCPLKIRK